jgi:plasmid stabilization system protein ParE
MAGGPPEVLRRPAAIRDLIELADGFDQVSQELSDRFLDAAEATVARLARSPGIGAPWEDEQLDLVGVRYSTVDQFRNQVIFDRGTGTGIEILRVVRAARDLRGLVGREAGDE